VSAEVELQTLEGSEFQSAVAWCSSNTLCPINKAALCRARLVLRWVTACGQINHLGM